MIPAATHSTRSNAVDFGLVAIRDIRSAKILHALAICCIAVLLTACGSEPIRAPEMPTDVQPQAATRHGRAVANYALSMIGANYHFGGKNPKIGFDCSGLVSYVFSHAASVKLTGSAADMAHQGRRIDKAYLRPGDLVFFNTRNRPLSHVGIYIGQGRFVHAPSTGSKVHISHLDNPYFAQHFEMARTYFN